MRLRHSLWIGLALAAAVACGKRAPEPPQGELRSQLTAPTLDGATFDPAALPGRVILVNFWSPG